MSEILTQDLFKKAIEEGFDLILDSLQIKKGFYPNIRNSIKNHIKGIAEATDVASLDKNIDKFNEYLISLSNTLQKKQSSTNLPMNPVTEMTQEEKKKQLEEMTPEEKITLLRKESASLINKIAQTKKSQFSSSTQENSNVCSPNNFLNSLEESYINRKWIPGSPKEAIYRLMKDDFKTYDFNKLKALLHVMALPRKNVFFTASYAETGSIKAFLKLINSPEYSDFKQKIFTGSEGCFIKKEDIITFIGSNFELKDSFKFN